MTALRLGAADGLAWWQDVAVAQEVFRDLPFPFEGDRFPDNLGAVVQRTVLSGEMPALEVIHTADNAWLVGDGVNDPNERGACVVACIWHVIEFNSSVASLARLPPGFIAWRDAPGVAWRTEEHVWPSDDAL
jgi:hypothetical protein